MANLITNVMVQMGKNKPITLKKLRKNMKGFRLHTK